MTANKKNVRVAPEAIEVILSGMTWVKRDGKFASVIVQQLDRALYTKVDKALLALGGKWNRKAKAHLFDHDPRPALGGLENSDTLTVDHYDAFYTPAWLIGRMIDEAWIPDTWTVDALEPSAGDGRIALAMREAGANVHCIEIDPKAVAVLRGHGFETVEIDFLNLALKPYDLIIMNPPFKNRQDVKHVLHAWGFLKPNGRLVAIMSEGAFFRANKLEVEFRELLAAHGWSEKLPKDTFKDVGTMVRTRLVVMNKSEVT